MRSLSNYPGQNILLKARPTTLTLKSARSLSNPAPQKRLVRSPGPSATLGRTSGLPSSTRGRSRMVQRPCPDLREGCAAMRIPTATEGGAQQCPRLLGRRSTSASTARPNRYLSPCAGLRTTWKQNGAYVVPGKTLFYTKKRKSPLIYWNSRDYLVAGARSHLYRTKFRWIPRSRSRAPTKLSV